MDDPPVIAVAGCGVVSAAGEGTDALAHAVQGNSSCLTRSGRFTGPDYQTDVVGAVPEQILEKVRASGEGDAGDLAFIYADHALTEARRDAEERMERPPSGKTGLVLSTTKADISGLETALEDPARKEKALTHVFPSNLARDLARRHGVDGPVDCVSVACASGLVALQQGARMIRRGDAEVVYVVGVDCLSRFVMKGFSSLKSLDADGCRPFDRDRKGLSPGEAGAAMVLAAEKHVSRRWGRILGWGTSNDANHLTGPSRDGAGVVRAAQRALKSANRNVSDVEYIHCHGTGTVYNDAMESAALRALFGENCPYWSSSKGILGHTLGAAGVVESMICLGALRSGVLPGTPRLEAPAPECPSGLIRVPRRQTVKHILKTNTGFGGVNAALVLSS